MKSTDLEAQDHSHSSVIVDRDRFIELLWEIDSQQDVGAFKQRIGSLLEVIASPNGETENWLAEATTDSSVSLRRDVLVSELNQILEARTIERARYYLKRLERGVKIVKTGKINDINLLRWKEHSEVITDSLWVLARRDSSGSHLGWYWGNFIPQIPHQLMLRYTKKGDWVLDPFLGSGTTLIECRRLGRNGLGIELSPEISQKAEELIAGESNRSAVTTRVILGDSRSVDPASTLKSVGANSAQLLIMHPPYHDIIKFSGDKRDLSNADSASAFLEMFNEVVDNFTPVLDRGRYFALVIGDKYSKGEWIPLGFQCMNEVLKREYSLKSIIVKNFEETRAKREQKQLWRYRALVGGFYIFKHEYVFLFKKN